MNEADYTVRDMKQKIIDSAKLEEDKDYTDHRNCSPENCHSRNQISITRSGWAKITEQVNA